MQLVVCVALLGLLWIPHTAPTGASPLRNSPGAGGFLIGERAHRTWAHALAQPRLPVLRGGADKSWKPPAPPDYDFSDDDVEVKDAIREELAKDLEQEAASESGEGSEAAVQMGNGEEKPLSNWALAYERAFGGGRESRRQELEKEEQDWERELDALGPLADAPLQTKQGTAGGKGARRTRDDGAMFDSVHSEDGNGVGAGESAGDALGGLALDGMDGMDEEEPGLARERAVLEAALDDAGSDEELAAMLSADARGSAEEEEPEIEESSGAAGSGGEGSSGGGALGAGDGSSEAEDAEMASGAETAAGGGGDARSRRVAELLAEINRLKRARAGGGGADADGRRAAQARSPRPAPCR
jgi:hypothetical protein